MEPRAQQHHTPEGAPLAQNDYSPDLEAALAASYSVKGDVSGLNAQDRERHYVQLCRALRLNPLTQPLQWLRLNGREVLYVGRGATDQLAALNHVTRETIRGPEVTDIGGTKVAVCVVRATLPSGRSETAHATLPVQDAANLYMKLETKAKRRATLSLLGLGMLDEMELETIPASERAALPRIDPRPEEPARATPRDAFSAALSATLTVWGAWSAYVDLPDQLRAEGLDPAADAPWAREAAGLRLRQLGLLLSAGELQALLGAQDAGDLARALDGVLAIPARDPEATARWWVGCRGALPRTTATLCYVVAARRCVGAEVIDAGTTRQGKAALGAAVAAYEASLRPEVTATREPGDESESELEPDWALTPEGIEAHAAGLTHPKAVLASARKHCTLPGYARVLAARLVALVGTDAQGTVLSEESALAQVTGAMAAARGAR